MIDKKEVITDDVQIENNNEDKKQTKDNFFKRVLISIKNFFVKGEQDQSGLVS